MGVLKFIVGFVVILFIMFVVGDYWGKSEENRINTICEENFEDKETDYKEDIYYLKSKYCPLVNNNDEYCKDFEQEKADRELVRKIMYK